MCSDNGLHFIYLVAIDAMVFVLIWWNRPAVYRDLIWVLVGSESQIPAVVTCEMYHWLSALLSEHIGQMLS